MYMKKFTIENMTDVCLIYTLGLISGIISTLGFITVFIK
jgi:hypothetical protein